VEDENDPTLNSTYTEIARRMTAAMKIIAAKMFRPPAHLLYD